MNSKRTYFNSNRSNAYYRHHRWRVINRKKKIAKGYGWGYKFNGQFSKGKIHCSCWMCSGKQRFHGISISDKKKIDKLEYVELD